MPAQSVANIRPNRSSPYIVRSLNPAVARIGTQRSARIGEQREITLDPATRQMELRTLAAMRERRALGIEQPISLDPATRETELRTLTTVRERRGFATQSQTLATIDPERRATTQNPAAAPQPQTHEAFKDTHAKKWHRKKDNISYDEAFRRHWHEWHNRNWWHDHCDRIVFVTTGYYFLDGSYWYPAWGYDPLQSYYDYDGPVYTYSDLLPDEVIANVQTALQDAGYYFGAITGSLSVDTRAALANFQRDYGLPITGAIDEATVEALGLY
jgi:Putative peptidoglycan binding domain